MSFVIQDSESMQVAIKTWKPLSQPGIVQFGIYTMTMDEFLKAAEYVLTYTELGQDDRRRDFIKRVKSLQAVGGFLVPR